MGCDTQNHSDCLAAMLASSSGTEMPCSRATLRQASMRANSPLSKRTARPPALRLLPSSFAVAM
eukprot:5070362-Karenia_brevis.AAC.1